MWVHIKALPPIKLLLGVVQSPRKLLFVNSLVLAICFTGVSAIAFLVCAIFYQSARAQNSQDTIFINWFVLGLVGMLATAICVIGMRGAHLVSFELLLVYFWGITMLVGPLLLAAVSGFDFYLFIEIWFSHYWQSASFSQIREFYCEPGTYDTECVAPIGGGVNYTSVKEWCLGEFDRDDCAAIREDAESKALFHSRVVILVQGCVGLFNVGQIAASIYMCVNILTASVITASMNDTINYLLLCPIGGLGGIAAYTWWMTKYDTPTTWLPFLFVALASISAVQLPLGIAAGRLKSRYMLAGSIFLLSIILMGLAASGITCILYAIIWSNSFADIERKTLDDIACEQDLEGCCCCDMAEDLEERCPEWSRREIVNYVVVTLKISGMISFLSMMYFFGAVAVAEILRQHLKHYKSDYI